MTDNPFLPETVSTQTAAINKAIVDKLACLPDQWSFPPAVVRQRRKEGKGPFPLEPKSTLARVEIIDGPGGDLPLRVIAPGEVRGVYLHIHGGGWVVGSTEEQDGRLERIAKNCRLAVVSVDYRLAPEAPYPAAPDDCEAAALWLAGNAKKRFGSELLYIGGESAGAHLSVVTLVRLRDRHRLDVFRAANLTAGCYDLAMTPSVRSWGSEKLILNTRDITKFIENFVPPSSDLGDPDISPIHADLRGLPPALFTVGSRDPLLDDSLFMAARWRAAGNTGELEVYPGGAHVFIAFASELSDMCLQRIDEFLNAH